MKHYTMNLNQLYAYLKEKCDAYKRANNPTAEWRAVMLHIIREAASEYKANGGKRDVDKIINEAEKESAK